MSNDVNDKRNYGIDAMRIIAMYMICMIHINAFSDTHTRLVSGHETLFYFSTFTESVGLIGVNIYAMITGFVSVKSQWKLQRYIILWIQVAFYTIFVYLFALILNNFGVLPIVSCGDIIKSLLKLPFGSTYWYFIAYTGLFFLIPFLNKPLLGLTKRKYVCLLVVLFGFLVLVNLVNNSEIYKGGYNLIWLICLYIAGAYIRLHNPCFKPLYTISLSLLCVLTPLVCRLLKLPAPMGYCYPNIVLYTFCFFILFYKLNITSPLIRRLISFFSPLTFGVYLIHQHPWGASFAKRVTREMFAFYDCSIIFPLLFAVVIFLVCSLIDYLRSNLFKICRVSQFSSFLAYYMDNMLKKSLRKIRE